MVFVFSVGEWNSQEDETDAGNVQDNDHILNYVWQSLFEYHFVVILIIINSF